MYVRSSSVLGAAESSISMSEPPVKSIPKRKPKIATAKMLPTISTPETANQIFFVVMTLNILASFYSKQPTRFDPLPSGNKFQEQARKHDSREHAEQHANRKGQSKTFDKTPAKQEHNR